MSKNIKSLDDLRDASDDEDEPGKTNDYYAGGEKSGQLIRGAPKEPESDEDDDKVASLFNRARKAGAVQGTTADMPSTSGAFQGTGRTLASGDGPAGQQARGQAEGPRTHVITFYRNGVFTVDDGPARRVEDPANFRFIDSIAKGECPDELEPSTPGAPVTVNLVRKDEDYAEPEKPKYQAFQGAGRTLGASTSAAAAAGASASTSAAAEAEEGEWPGADDKKPTTSLQLRMADGSRMVAKFNTTDKVSDIRRFIRAARRDLAGAQYQLMTAFPSQLIADESKTLEEAGLLNAVIIQKM